MDRPCTCEKEGCRLCWLYHHDLRYHRMWGGKSPTLLQKAWMLTRAVANHVIQGLPLVSYEVFQKRITICESCSYFTGDRGCHLCGCHMDIKATWAEQQCPDDPPRWLAEVKK